MELNRNCVVFNTKWVTDLNIKLKTIKLLEIIWEEIFRT